MTTGAGAHRRIDGSGHWFRCPLCNTIIGRIDGKLLRCEVGRVRAVFPLMPGARFFCHRCGGAATFPGVLESAPASQDGRDPRATP